jgi:hypothetical protein
MPRACTICLHPERAAIDGDLVAGLPAPQAAAKYRVSEDALTRHREHHLPAALVESASALRRAALTQATRQLCEATGEAVETLRRNLRAFRKSRRTVSQAPRHKVKKEPFPVVLTGA